LLITDKIQTAIENKEYACGIFLDLKKAFDTVDHKILLKKGILWSQRANKSIVFFKSNK
jgi:hypothetical protein